MGYLIITTAIMLFIILYRLRAMNDGKWLYTMTLVLLGSVILLFVLGGGLGL